MMPADIVKTSMNDTDETSRKAIIQAADPYFPHTFWRAVLWGTAMGLMVLGFVSITVVVFDLDPIGWFQIGMIAAQMVATAGVCYFGRGFREQILVSQGKIFEKEENL